MIEYISKGKAKLIVSVGSGATRKRKAKTVTYTTKKELESREAIRKYSKDFDGHNTDAECMKLIGISRGSFYKYKKTLWNETHSAPDSE